MTSIKHLILQRKQHSYKDVLKEAVHKVAELKSAELGDCNLNFCCTGSQEN